MQTPALHHTNIVYHQTIYDNQILNSWVSETAIDIVLPSVLHAIVAVQHSKIQSAWLCLNRLMPLSAVGKTAWIQTWMQHNMPLHFGIRMTNCPFKQTEFGHIRNRRLVKSVGRSGCYRSTFGGVRRGVGDRG